MKYVIKNKEDISTIIPIIENELHCEIGKYLPSQDGEKINVENILKRLRCWVIDVDIKLRYEFEDGKILEEVK